MVEPPCSNFRVITSIYRSSEILGLLQLVIFDRDGDSVLQTTDSSFLCLIPVIGSIVFCLFLLLLFFLSCSACFLHMSRLATKPTKWHVRPAKTQISLGIRPVWSESSLSAWRKLGSLATRWPHSEDSDQTGQMPRLIWIFTGCTIILLVLSWGGSIIRAVQR